MDPRLRLLPESVRPCEHGRFVRSCPVCSPRPILLFVYGTLMHGGAHHRLLARAGFLGKARTRHGYRLHDLCGLPAMARVGGSKGYVLGEIYEVRVHDMPAIDRLLATSHCERAKVEVLGFGSIVETHVVRSRTRVESAPVVLDGDWTVRITTRGDHATEE